MSKLSQVTLCRTESGHHQVRTEPYAMVAAVNAACSLQESMLAAVVQDGAVLHFVTSTRYSVGLKSVSFFQERQGGGARRRGLERERDAAQATSCVALWGTCERMQLQRGPYSYPVLVCIVLFEPAKFKF